MSDDPIARMLQRHVDAGEIAGAVTLVHRFGAPDEVAVAGWQDMAAGAPMDRGSILRIASLTKPVVSTAALRLYDRGLFALDEPICDRAPEFAGMRVLADPEGALDDTVPAVRPITFLDLLTHRAGLTYGAFHRGPLAEAYAQALGPDIDSPLSPDAWMAALARLPLIDQPGAGFHYGVSTDLLGLLLARIAGTTLPDLLEQLVFRPLGMTDTGFSVPPDKRHRRAVMYGFDDEGRLEARPSHPVVRPAFLAERPEGLGFCSGGAGLWSTVDDYARFARLFVNDGAVDGVRLLKVETVRRMTANYLTPDQAAAAMTMGRRVFQGHGFGLGVAVVTDPDRADVLRCQGGIGTVGWPGAYGGWWQADPTDGTVMVFLAQNALDPERLARGLGLGVFAAITDFHALARPRPRN